MKPTNDTKLSCSLRQNPVAGELKAAAGSPLLHLKACLLVALLLTPYRATAGSSIDLSILAPPITLNTAAKARYIGCQQAADGLLNALPADATNATNSFPSTGLPNEGDYNSMREANDSPLGRIFNRIEWARYLREAADGIVTEAATTNLQSFESILKAASSNCVAGVKCEKAAVSEMKIDVGRQSSFELSLGKLIAASLGFSASSQTTLAITNGQPLAFVLSYTLSTTVLEENLRNALKSNRCDCITVPCYSHFYFLPRIYCRVANATTTKAGLGAPYSASIAGASAWQESYEYSYCFSPLMDQTVSELNFFKIDNQRLKKLAPLFVRWRNGSWGKWKHAQTVPITLNKNGSLTVGDDYQLQFVSEREGFGAAVPSTSTNGLYAVVRRTDVATGPSTRKRIAVTGLVLQDKPVSGQGQGPVPSYAMCVLVQSPASGPPPKGFIENAVSASRFYLDSPTNQLSQAKQ